MLNELEKAHIHIEQLHQRLAELEANPAMAEKIDLLEATVAQQRKEYAELKAMVIDLQTHSSSGELWTSLK